MVTWINKDGTEALRPSTNLREACGGGGNGGASCGSYGLGRSSSSKKSSSKKAAVESVPVSSPTFGKWEAYLLKQVMSNIDDWIVDFSENPGVAELDDDAIAEILLKTRKKLKQAL